jgi:hypothetical protein
VDLPSFLWLWKIAAWSMGFSILAYSLLTVSGLWMYGARRSRQRGRILMRSLHYGLGLTLVALVLLLLAVGIVGTLGHYGSLGHSSHLGAGLLVVALVGLSAWSAHQIRPGRPWARSLHVTTNAILFVALAWVSWTGWTVVQKYLP